MSQIFKSSVSGPSPPTVPTQFTTDSGIAIPAANNLNVVTPGGGTQGIMTSGAGSTITITVFPADVTGSVTTVGAQTLPVITFPLGATPGTYTFDCSVAGFATSGVGSPAGCGFTIVGSVRTDGATGTLVPNQAVDHFEEAVLTGVTSLIAVSGNNALINVSGISDGGVGFVINWTSFLSFTFAS